MVGMNDNLSSDQFGDDVVHVPLERFNDHIPAQYI